MNPEPRSINHVLAPVDVPRTHTLGHYGVSTKNREKLPPEVPFARRPETLNPEPCVFLLQELAPEYLRHYRKGGHFMDSHDGKGTLT